MGQSLSVESDDVKHFRKMLIHSYYGNLEKLKKHMFVPAIEFQVSRASFLKLCQYRTAKMEQIVDSLQREAAMDKFVDEKMEFSCAVESGDIVLGDTILHIAARMGHSGIVCYLLRNNVGMEIPNFSGETVLQCCKTRAIYVVVEDCLILHKKLGDTYEEMDKANNLMQNLRRLWPLWMFNTEESSRILTCIFQIRSNDAYYNRLIDVAKRASERYEYQFTAHCLRVATDFMIQADGIKYRARTRFAGWDDAQKLGILFQFFADQFLEFEPQYDVDQDMVYLELVERTMDTWLTIVEEYQIHESDNATIPDAKELEKHHELLWAHRLCPPSYEVDNICVHLNGLEDYLQISDLKA